MSVLEALTPIIDVFTNPSSRTHWVGLLVFVVGYLWYVGIRSMGRYIRQCYFDPSVHLDVQLLVFNRVVRLLWVTVAASATWSLAIETTSAMRMLFGESPFVIPVWQSALLYSGVLFVLDDVSRFLLHRSLL